MVVDLVGSTSLSTRIDPEIMADLLASYKAGAAEEVVRDGGTVAKDLGDGILAYFGWPTRARTRPNVQSTARFTSATNQGSPGSRASRSAAGRG